LQLIPVFGGRENSEETEMTARLLSVPSALLVGIALGWLLQRVHIHPLTQSVAAFLAGSIAGSALSAMLWLAFPPAGADVLAVTTSLKGSAMALVLGALVAAGAHFVVVVLTPWLPSLALHRPILLGVLGALAGVATFGTTGGLVRPVG
jgi:hypothetical protein